jgi:hypothetical protein
VTDDKGANSSASVTITVNAAPSVDKVAPTAPADLRIVYVTRTSIDLDWQKATDNVGVVRYDIYQNGVYKNSTTETEFEVENLTMGVVYRFLVKAVDKAGNVSVASNQVVGIPVLIGLEYRYYEGEWSSLPNFNNLTPVKKGITDDINLNMVRPGVTKNYGVVWEGYLKISKPGTYTFETISDDGSKFYFNSEYLPGATALVNNDGVHGERSISTSIYVPSAGVYPIAVTFFQKAGDATMKLLWKGPGINRQEIPSSAFSDISGYWDNDDDKDKKDKDKKDKDKKDKDDDDKKYRDHASAGNDLNVLSESQQADNLLNAQANGVTITRAYPAPFRNFVKVELTNNIYNSQVTIDVYDLFGKLVHKQNFGNLPAGRLTLEVNFSNKELTDGMYMMKVNVNGKSAAALKLLKVSN